MGCFGLGYRQGRELPKSRIQKEKRHCVQPIAPCGDSHSPSVTWFPPHDIPVTAKPDSSWGAKKHQSR